MYLEETGVSGGAEGGGGGRPARPPAVVGVESVRLQDPIIPADVPERHVERLPAALRHASAADRSRRAPLRAPLGRRRFAPISLHFFNKQINQFSFEIGFQFWISI